MGGNRPIEFDSALSLQTGESAQHRVDDVEWRLLVQRSQDLIHEVLFFVSSHWLVVLNELDLQLADHLVKEVEVDDHVLEIAIEPWFQSQDLHRAAVLHHFLEDLFHFFRSLCKDLQSHDICHACPSLVCWHVFFAHNFGYLFSNAEDVGLATNLDF